MRFTLLRFSRLMLWVFFRGSKAVSRLASYHPDRFVAYAFVVVPFCPVSPDNEFHASLVNTEKLFGYPLYSYWLFFGEGDADGLFRKHVSISTLVIGHF